MQKFKLAKSGPKNLMKRRSIHKQSFFCLSKKIGMVLASLLVLLLFMGTVELLAQEPSSDLSIDKENQEFLTDLNLDEFDYFKKYVDQYASVSSQQLYRAYSNEENPNIRALMLHSAIKKGWGDPIVVEIFTWAIQSGIGDKHSLPRNYVSSNWKVRATAAHLIHENPTGIERTAKEQLAFALFRTLQEDPNDRCQGLSALALAKLLEGEKEPQTGSLIHQEFLVTTLQNKLDRTSIFNSYLAWSLVRALGYLKSPRSFYPLLKIRNRGYIPKVHLEISRTLNAITSGSQ